ncbi:DUF1465 family protein [Qipengyuania atrilutea]|uniref:DUF1465 family protein n=1 Tax=Qipengyuania atrilutea TaxID=2744473 RepID=A0A850H305_9SPHN|nr:DUF1465 family protein [Actirhodobacter atriluteus]NVD44970.1 DUF1465 family protein [Actirhodobacter atriluteus]
MTAAGNLQSDTAPRGEMLNRQIVDDLYSEALLLADEARAVFDMRGGSDDALPATTKLALSVEGLKTTTRIMHVLAWLLNQRAFFAGDLTLKQLAAHGRLPKDRASDARQVELLPALTQHIVERTEQLHARVARLELRAASEPPQTQDGGVHAIQDKLRNAFPSA